MSVSNVPPFLVFAETWIVNPLASLISYLIVHDFFHYFLAAAFIGWICSSLARFMVFVFIGWIILNFG